MLLVLRAVQENKETGDAPEMLMLVVLPPIYSPS